MSAPVTTPSRDIHLPTGADLPAVEVPVDLEVGETLNGAWRLDAKVGEGGMGRVFRATELKLGRKVAVKALLNSHLDDDTVKRFEREAQVMARLDHPSVVTLYGVGRHRNIPFLVMKLLEGKSLWGVLDSHGTTMPLAVMVPIARQLLTALGYIHGKGLLHRDLKPSNIFVSPQGKVTLLDLGLARGHQSSLTRTGVIWGTPDFMAPEQIVGERQLDGRADLYAFAVVLFRMLSGEPPFPQEDEQELMRAHLLKPRPDAAKVNPAIPVPVALVIQKGMAIKPEERFKNAEEMLQALERAAAPNREAPTTARAELEPLPVPPPPGRATAQRPGRRAAGGATDVEPALGPPPLPATFVGGRAELVATQVVRPGADDEEPELGTVVDGSLRAMVEEQGPGGVAPTVLAKPTTPLLATVPSLPAVSTIPINPPATVTVPGHREHDTAPSGPIPLELTSGGRPTNLDPVQPWQRPAVLAIGAAVILAVGVLIGVLLR